MSTRPTRRLSLLYTTDPTDLILASMLTIWAGTSKRFRFMRFVEKITLVPDHRRMITARPRVLSKVT